MDGKMAIKAKISLLQGHLLLETAYTFTMPESLDKTSYSTVERAVAMQCVAKLFRELKAHSPKLQGPEKLSIFGPSEFWKKETNGSWTMKDPDVNIEIRLDDDAIEGAYYCLLVLLHPSSPRKAPVGAGVMDDILWPLAKTLRLYSMLERDLGLQSAIRRKIDLDVECMAEPLVT